MFPTEEEIQRAAYDRWQRRGSAHGRDFDDWYDAEQELLFTKNYRLIARFRLDGVAEQTLGNALRPVCRFCERSSLQTPFTRPHRPLPRTLANAALVTWEECDECHEHFRESLERDLLQFAGPYVAGKLGLQHDVEPSFVPIAAFKGLVRLGLAMMPEPELHTFRDTLEWVSNADHWLDHNAIGKLECVVCVLPDPLPFSLAVLAMKVDDDAPFPHMMLFWGTGRAMFQLPLPLCSRDEDLDGEPLHVPRVGLLPGIGPRHVESAVEVVPMGSPVARGLTSATA